MTIEIKISGQDRKELINAERVYDNLTDEYKEKVFINVGNNLVMGSLLAELLINGYTSQTNPNNELLFTRK